MIPSSAAALVSFLLLLAPGIVWQLQRARHRPSVKETSLVEASRVILASLLATTVAGGLLVWVWLPLYRSAETGSPSAFDSPVFLVPYAGAVVATSMLACGLALITAAITWRGRPPISEVRVWMRAFVDVRPSGSAMPYLTVELLDDTVWRGEFVMVDSDPEDDQRSLAIGPPLRRRRPGDVGFEDKDAKGGGWQLTILPESQIKSIQVFYPPAD